ncbi:MAG: hypothetical protein ACFB21_07820 [Opitutales bacterium]
MKKEFFIASILFVGVLNTSLANLHRSVPSTPPDLSVSITDNSFKVRFFALFANWLSDLANSHSVEAEVAKLMPRIEQDLAKSEGVLLGVRIIKGAQGPSQFLSVDYVGPGSSPNSAASASEERASMRQSVPETMVIDREKSFMVWVTSSGVWRIARLLNY